MWLEPVFWCSAAVSLIAAVWLFFSRSIVPLIVNAVALAGVLLCTGWLCLLIWPLVRRDGIDSVIFGMDWSLFVPGFLLPLTASIVASSVAWSVRWRRKRKLETD